MPYLGDYEITRINIYPNCSPNHLEAIDELLSNRDPMKVRIAEVAAYGPTWKKLLDVLADAHLQHQEYLGQHTREAYAATEALYDWYQYCASVVPYALRGGYNFQYVMHLVSCTLREREWRREAQQKKGGGWGMGHWNLRKQSDMDGAECWAAYIGQEYRNLIRFCNAQSAAHFGIRTDPHWAVLWYDGKYTAHDTLDEAKALFQ